MKEQPRRLRNWRAALADHVCRHADTRFAWGSFDCVIWAASCVDAQCGTKIADEWRDRYTDERGAFRLLRDRGWTSLAEAVRDYLGDPIQNYRRAATGDIVWVPRQRRVVAFGRFGALLLVNNTTLIGVNPRGLVALPRWTDAIGGGRAFRVVGA